ncbi:MAG: molecular chaperone DnaJ [Candidatus Heimdallarchaeota archaeon]
MSSSSKRDPYKVLGVNKNATPEEIKKAYRRLARKNHPDANPGDENAEKRFKEISESYSILSDADLKAAYDRMGWSGLSATAGGTGGDPFAGGGFGNMNDIFGSIFGDIFGMGSRTSRRQRTGRNIRVAVPVTFEEAAAGVEKNIEMKKNVTCKTCSGSGASPGTTPIQCSTCRGSGIERIQQRTPFGIMQSDTACRRCNGEGSTISTPCSTCRGTGMTEKKVKVKVPIPAGVDNGQRLRLSGQGEPGPRGTPPGDLHIFIQLKKHKYFEREGTELIFEQKINMAQAALGDTVFIPTLVKNEKAKLKIPAGTQTSNVFRLKGKGFPSLNSYGKGDMHVIITIETPKKLSSREKELFGELKDLLGEKTKKK